MVKPRRVERGLGRTPHALWTPDCVVEVITLPSPLYSVLPNPTRSTPPSQDAALLTAPLGLRPHMSRLSAFSFQLSVGSKSCALRIAAALAPQVAPLPSSLSLTPMKRLEINIHKSTGVGFVSMTDGSVQQQRICKMCRHNPSPPLTNQRQMRGGEGL